MNATIIHRHFEVGKVQKSPQICCYVSCSKHLRWPELVNPEKLGYTTIYSPELDSPIPGIVTVWPNLVHQSLQASMLAEILTRTWMKAFASLTFTVLGKITEEHRNAFAVLSMVHDYPLLSSLELVTHDSSALPWAWQNDPGLVCLASFCRLTTVFGIFSS